MLVLVVMVVEVEVVDVIVEDRCAELDPAGRGG